MTKSQYRKRLREILRADADAYKLLLAKLYDAINGIRYQDRLNNQVWEQAHADFDREVFKLGQELIRKTKELENG